jgi:hypothetical protein
MQRSHLIILSICCALFVTSSCNNTFDPIQQDHPYAFNLYGFLDVHADTQFVRAMPILKVLLPQQSDSIDYQVTITRTSTQEIIQMIPERIDFGIDLSYWNFLTSIPIYPNESYLIRSMNSEGVHSSVLVNTPNSLAEPVVNDYNTVDESGLITGIYSDTIVSVGMLYTYTIGLDDYVYTTYVSHLDEGLLSNGSYRYRFRNFTKLPRNYRMIKREFHIVTASTSYPELMDLSFDEMTIPSLVTNVENGTGFVAGISRRIVTITP